MENEIQGELFWNENLKKNCIFVLGFSSDHGLKGNRVQIPGCPRNCESATLPA